MTHTVFIDGEAGTTGLKIFELLQGFEAEDWVGSGLELMDDRQFILTA